MFLRTHRGNMDEYNVKRLALVLAVQAEIEGMKSYNVQRIQADLTPGYGEDHFFAKAEELRILASKHNEQL